MQSVKNEKRQWVMIYRPVRKGSGTLRAPSYPMECRQVAVVGVISDKADSGGAPNCTHTRDKYEPTA